MSHDAAKDLPVVAVVVTFRRPRLASEVVRHLVEGEGLPPGRVVLVVNGEGGLEDNSLAQAIKVVELAENIGPAGGFREGMAVARTMPRAEWLYLCEDDVSLFDLPLARLARLVRDAALMERTGGPGIGAIVAYGRDLHGRTGHSTVHHVSNGAGYEPVDVASWGATLVSRRVLDGGVLPDSSYFFGYEDFDFFLQIRDLGLQVLVDCESARAVAANMTMAGRDEAFAGRRPTDADEPWRAFYVSRNYFRLARRHGSWTWLAAHLAYSLRRIQLASSKPERQALVRGLLAGLKGRTGKDERYLRERGELGLPVGRSGPPAAGPEAGGPHALRVLHVLASDGARGAQIFARDLSALLDRDGQEHRILTLFRATTPAVHADFALALGMGRTRTAGFDPRVPPKLRRVLHTFRPDVIVAHGGEPLKYLVVSGRHRMPVVYLAIGTTTKAARVGARYHLYRALMGGATVVVGVSAEVVEQAENVFGVPHNRTRLIYNARDPELFRPSGRRRESDCVELIFVGHLGASKRPLAFVSAVEALRQEGHAVRGTVVGDGPLASEVRRAAALSGSVDVLGRRDDIASLLRRADVFVFTSLPESEGLPGVLIEAALSGLPSVTTAVPGASTAVEDGVTGFLVQPDDHRALVGALERLVSDARLRARMGEAARRRAVESLSLETVAAQWRELLSSLSVPGSAQRAVPR